MEEGAGFGFGGDGRNRGAGSLTVLTTARRPVLVLLVTSSGWVVHWGISCVLYRHIFISNGKIDIKRRVSVGGGSHVAEPEFCRTLLRRAAAEDAQSLLIGRGHLDVFTGVVHSMGVLLGEEVGHSFDGRLFPRGQLRAVNHQEVTLLRPTGQVAIEVEEVVVA